MPVPRKGAAGGTPSLCLSQAPTCQRKPPDHPSPSLPGRRGLPVRPRTRPGPVTSHGHGPAADKSRSAASSQEAARSTGKSAASNQVQLEGMLNVVTVTHSPPQKLDVLRSPGPPSPGANETVTVDGTGESKVGRAGLHLNNCIIFLTLYSTIVFWGST